MESCSCWVCGAWAGQPAFKPPLKIPQSSILRVLVWLPSGCVAAVGKQVLVSKCQSGAPSLTAVRGSLAKTELSMGLFALTRLAANPSARARRDLIIMKICWHSERLGYFLKSSPSATVQSFLYCAEVHIGKRLSLYIQRQPSKHPCNTQS